MSKPGSHWYVQLQDLVTYQDAMQSRRREILGTMAREAAEADLYEGRSLSPPIQAASADVKLALTNMV